MVLKGLIAPPYRALMPWKSCGMPGSGRTLLELAWISQVRDKGDRPLFRLALTGYATTSGRKSPPMPASALLAVDVSSR